MKLLYDSNFLIALYKRDDSTHKKAVDLAKRFHTAGVELHALNLVVQESTTVISIKMGMDHARAYYKGLSSIVDTFITLDDITENLSWKLFKKQTKKGTSFIDCANLATLEYYKLDKILSFDEFYPKNLRL